MTLAQSCRLSDRLAIDLPMIQTPMAGVSTLTMAAAVRNAGAWGSIAIGARPESLADDDFRAARHSEASRHTVMTRAISGRSARCLANRLTALGATIPVDQIPNYLSPMMPARP